MKPKFLIKLALLSLTTSFSLLDAQNFNFQWAKQFGGTISGTAYSITRDPSGNIYTTGEFQGTMDFDPGPLVYNLTSFGQPDIFISKADSAGNLIWVKQMGGSNINNAYCIALDNSGNIYTTGSFWGTADFDPGPSTYTLMANTGMYNTFISKLDASGNFVWAKQIQGNFFGAGSSIVVDNSGDVYSTGHFYSVMDFDPGPGTYNLSAFNGDSYILKLDASGNFVWAKQMFGITLSSTNVGSSITLDGLGNLYATGHFEGKVDFDPGPGTFTYTSNGGRDIYIVKLDTSGNFIWAEQVGGFGYDYGLALKSDLAGDVYVTGYFANAVDFDPGPGNFVLSTTGNFDNDIYVLKLNSSGNFVWASQMGNSQNDNANNIALDAAGNIYTTGQFQGNVDFDPGVGTFTLSSFGAEDAFISKLDASGNFVWARQLGGSGSDIPYGLMVDPSYNVFTTGSFSATADFDPGIAGYNLTPVGSGDIFVSKLGNCILPSSPTNSTTMSNLFICSGNSTTLTAVGSGTVMWYSLSSSGSILGTGNNYVTPTLSTGTYTYYAEDYTCGASIPRTPITVTVSSCIGVNPIPFEVGFDFKVFPNPALNTLHISIEQNHLKNSEIEIANTLGQTVLKSPYRNEIDVSQLSKGSYILKIIGSNKHQYSSKFIKE